MGGAALKRGRTAIPSLAAREKWNELTPALISEFKAISQTFDAERARESFVNLTAALRPFLLRFNFADGTYEVECPMAYEDGARWLQASDSVENPYFDGYMKSCGTVLGELSELGESDE